MEKIKFMFFTIMLIIQINIFCSQESMVIIPNSSQKKSFLHSFYNAKLFNNIKLTDAEAFKICYTLFNEPVSKERQKLLNNFNIYTPRNVEKYTNTMANVFSIIDKTETIFGKLVLDKFLSQDYLSKEQILDRQNKIKELRDNTELFNGLKESLSNISKIQKSFLSYYDPVFEKILNQMNELFHKKDFERCKILLLYIFNTYLLGVTVKNATIIPQRIKMIYQSDYSNLFLKKFTRCFWYCFFDYELGGYCHRLLGQVATLPQAVVFLHTMFSYSGFARSKARSISILAKEYKKIENICKNNTVLSSLIPQKNISTELLEMLESDSHETYDIHRQMLKEKQTLKDMMLTIGKIDAYISLAHLIKNSKDQKQEYCLSEFIENRTPFIKAENLWNPILNPEKASIVNNCLELGASNKNKNMIFTGFNGGGKSILAKAMGMSIFFSKTLGIAPAKSFKTTYFKDVIISIPEGDNPDENLSHFQHELNRSRLFIKQLTQNGTVNDHYFLILDELIEGSTAPKNTIDLVYDIGKTLSMLPNVLFILITQFQDKEDKIVCLEQDTNGICKNYNIKKHHLHEGISNDNGAAVLAKPLKDELAALRKIYSLAP